MKFFVLLFSLLSLTGCASHGGYNPKVNATIAYYPAYEEQAKKPKGFWNRVGNNWLSDMVTGPYYTEWKGNYTFYSHIVFQADNDGEEIRLGCRDGTACPRPGFLFDVVKPGRYTLKSYALGSGARWYDPAKCGKISFTVQAGDFVVLKSISPAATDGWDPLGLFNRAALPEFDGLPPDYMKVLKDSDSDVEKALALSKLRIVSPVSSNPAAFQKCVRALGGNKRMVPF